MKFAVRLFPVLCTALVLASCGTASPYAFPTQLPSGASLNSDYQWLHHDLSPLPAYHFRIMIPNGWKTLDVKIQQEPAKGGLADVAVFRQPGEWMQDPTKPINGEISISVVNVEGNTQTPSDWLMAILQKNAQGFQLLNKRLSPSAAGDVSDVLIKYTSGTDTIISRLMAFKSADHMFVITGSDTANEYAQNAQAFNVAISTFRLDTAGQQLSSSSGIILTPSSLASSGATLSVSSAH